MLTKTRALYLLTPAGTLEEIAPRKPSAMRTAQSLAECIPGLCRSHLFALVRETFLRMHYQRQQDQAEESSQEKREEASPSHGENLTHAIFRECVSICRDNGWPVVVLNVGVGSRVINDLCQRRDEQGVDIIAAPSKDERPDLYYVHDGHWNPLGHQHVAESMIDYLSRNEGFLSTIPIASDEEVRQLGDQKAGGNRRY